MGQSKVWVRAILTEASPVVVQSEDLTTRSGRSGVSALRTAAIFVDVITKVHLDRLAASRARTRDVLLTKKSTLSLRAAFPYALKYPLG